MKCQMCSAEIVKRGHNQKYCTKCAAKAKASKMKEWREKNIPARLQRHCPDCGEVLKPYRRFCDNCLAQHNIG